MVQKGSRGGPEGVQKEIQTGFSGGLEGVQKRDLDGRSTFCTDINVSGN